MENESIKIKMEKEPLNCCNKISKNIIGFMGIVFSFGLVAFFGFVFMVLEVRLIFAVLIFCKFVNQFEGIFLENFCVFSKFKNKF